MRVAYVDTSVMVAIAFGEPESTLALRQLERFDRFVSSNLLEAELASALARHGVTRTPARLLSRFDWLYPDRPLTGEIERILGYGYLRGADLWHAACALYLSPDPGRLAFLTLDKRQEAVVAAAGFQIS